MSPTTLLPRRCGCSHRLAAGPSAAGTSRGHDDLLLLTSADRNRLHQRSALDTVTDPPVDYGERVEVSVREIREREESLRIASGRAKCGLKSRIQVGDPGARSACRPESLLLGAKELASPLFGIRRCNHQVDGVAGAGHHAATRLPNQSAAGHLVGTRYKQGANQGRVELGGELHLLHGHTTCQCQCCNCGSGQKNSLHVFAFFLSSHGMYPQFVAHRMPRSYRGIAGFTPAASPWSAAAPPAALRARRQRPPAWPGRRH